MGVEWGAKDEKGEGLFDRVRSRASTHAATANAANANAADANAATKQCEAAAPMRASPPNDSGASAGIEPEAARQLESKRVGLSGPEWP